MRRKTKNGQKTGGALKRTPISPTIGATATTMRRPTALRIGVMDNGNGARSLPRMTPVTLAPFRRTRGTRRRTTSPRKPTRR